MECEFEVSILILQKSKINKYELYNIILYIWQNVTCYNNQCLLKKIVRQGIKEYHLLIFKEIPLGHIKIANYGRMILSAARTQRVQRVYNFISRVKLSKFHQFLDFSKNANFRVFL